MFERTTKWTGYPGGVVSESGEMVGVCDCPENRSCPKDLGAVECCDSCSYHEEMLTRLAKYEDLGMSPEDLSELISGLVHA